MNTSDNDGWIKLSERKPTVDDLPILFWKSTERERCKLCTTEDQLRNADNMQFYTYSHWQPTKLPAPPKKELTQREKDEEKCELSWLHKGAGQSLPEFRCGFYAALAYRDKQNREDLKELHEYMTSSYGEIVAFESLRKRCGLDK